MQGFIWASVVVFLLWATGAIAYLHYLPLWLRVIAMLLWIAGIVWSAWAINNAYRWRALMGLFIAVVYLATLPIHPRNDREWATDQAQLTSIVIDDDDVTIENFRNFSYQSENDYDEHWLTKKFSLSQIQSVWLIVQRFTSNDGLAHVFLSFELAPDEEQTSEYFSLSIEIRREVGEEFGPIKGLYRNYELAHIVGDERDMIGVRTVHRPNDRVYLYRLNASPEKSQKLFRNFSNRITLLNQQPEFYHTLLNNCANGITSETHQLTKTPIHWMDYRIVLPGYAADYAFKHGLIKDPDGGETFKQLEQRSRIDAKARAAGITETFSQDIRVAGEF